MDEDSSDESRGETETPITYPSTPLSSGIKHLPCPYDDCSKSFNRKSRLSEHLRSHTNERPFKCSERLCDKSFLRDSHLKHHVKSAHTNERDYPCLAPNCHKKFATGTRLRRHEESHRVKDQYTCKGYDGCSETFRKHATLNRHILAVHEGKKPFPCPDVDWKTNEPCSAGFDNAEKLRSHQRAMHDRSRFMCMICLPSDSDEQSSTISFPTYALLQTHMAESHPPTCPECTLQCESEKALRRHLELIHNRFSSLSPPPPSFPCPAPDCTRSFSKKGNLNVHTKTVHEHRRDFTCGVTGLDLVHLLPIDAQLEALEPEGNTIPGCGRHFTSKASLEEHVRTAHLGTMSKRQQQNRRKRGTEDASPDYMQDLEEAIRESTRPKRRRTRDRKATGARKGKSIIDQLAGPPSPAPINPYDSEDLEDWNDDVFLNASYPCAEQITSHPSGGFNHLISNGVGADGALGEFMMNQAGLDGWD